MLATYALPIEDYGYVTEGLLFPDVVPNNVLAGFYCVPSATANALVGLQNSFPALFPEQSLAGPSYAEWREVAGELGSEAFMDTQPPGTLLPGGLPSPGGTAPLASAADGLQTYLEARGVDQLVEVVGMFPSPPPTEIGHALAGDLPQGFAAGLPTWEYFAEAFAQGYAVVTTIYWLNDTLDGPTEAGGHTFLAVGMQGDEAAVANGTAELVFIDSMRAFDDVAFDRTYMSSDVPSRTSPTPPMPTSSTVALKTTGAVAASAKDVTIPGEAGLDSTVLQGGLLLTYREVSYEYQESSPAGWYANDVGPGTGLIVEAMVVRLKPMERPPLRPAATIAVAVPEWGPHLPVTVDFAALAGAVSGQATEVPYVVTSVVGGGLEIEENGAWREVADTPVAASPAELLRFLADRVVTPSERVRWTPPQVGLETVEAFRLVGALSGADSESTVSFVPFPPSLVIGLA